MPSLTELEERLAIDKDREVRTKLVRQLTEMEGNLRAKVSSGISREDFALAQALCDACLAACETLEGKPPG